MEVWISIETKLAVKVLTSRENHVHIFICLVAYILKSMCSVKVVTASYILPISINTVVNKHRIITVFAVSSVVLHCFALQPILGVMDTLDSVRYKHS